jgi:hypothetical protein
MPAMAHRSRVTRAQPRARDYRAASLDGSNSDERRIRVYPAAVQIPAFLARQFYVAGSLRNTTTGFALDAHNPLGDGTLVGIGALRVDGRDIDPAAVTAQRGGETNVLRAAEVSAQRPIAVRRGDSVTLHVDGMQLEPGEHRLEVELYEVNLGLLRLALDDTLGSGT